MNTARFNFIAGRLAPQRASVVVDWQQDGSRVQLDCGHAKRINPQFHVAVGEKLPCYDCGEIAARQLPEFN